MNAIKSVETDVGSPQDDFKMEELKIPYEWLKKVNELRTNFVQELTHEILTPLTIIRGSAEYLLNFSSRDQQLAMVQLILKHEQQLEHIVTRKISELINFLECNLVMTRNFPDSPP